MKKRVSRAVREQAALICAIAASSDGAAGMYIAAWALGLPSPPRLVEQALEACIDLEATPEWYAEAEAMIRTKEFP